MATLINNGRYITVPEWSLNINKATIREMISKDEAVIIKTTDNEVYSLDVSEFPDFATGELLAAAIEASANNYSSSVPGGGNAGQVLVKDSNSDFDMRWADPNEASGGTIQLGYTPSANGGTVTNSSGANAVIPLATALNAGLLGPSARNDIIAAKTHADSPHADPNAQQNVQSNWNETSPLNDAFIQNKPVDLTNLALHSATELDDIIDVGSGNIITAGERSKLESIETNAEANNIDDAAAEALTTNVDASSYHNHNSIHPLIEDVPTNTDELPEGSNNKYYTDGRVNAHATIIALQDSSHTHANKSLLDNIDQSLETTDDVVFATVNGRDIDIDGTKLDGIEAGAEVNNVSDVNAAALVGTGNTNLHYHDTDRDRSNHTGVQLASTISDFNSAVANADSVQINSQKRSYPISDELKLDGIEENAEVNNMSDLNVSDLTDGLDTELHYHIEDRRRSNHTGTQLANTISDLSQAISNNEDVVSSQNHINSDGSSHTFIDQDVTTNANPTFVGTKIKAEDTQSYGDMNISYRGNGQSPQIAVGPNEEHLYPGRSIAIRGYNSTGVAIASNKIVAINNYTGDWKAVVEIEEADQKSIDKDSLLGITNSEILNNEVGEVTILGVLFDFTIPPGVSSGTLYLNPTSPGSITNTVPTAEHFIVNLGILTKTNVVIFNPKIQYPQESSYIQSGFTEEGIDDTSIYFNPITRELTLEVVGGPYHYYDEGVRYFKSTNQTVAIADTTGIHITYFDGDQLISSVNLPKLEILDIISRKCVISIIIWDSNKQELLFIGDDRTTLGVDGKLAASLYNTHGLAFDEGLTPTVLANGLPNEDSSISLGMSSGMVSLPGKSISINPLNFGVRTYTTYYHDTDGLSRATADCGILTGINGLAVYNDLNSGTLEEAPDNSFVLYHLFISSSNEFPYFFVVGDTHANTINEIHQKVSTSVNNIDLGPIPKTEVILLATFVVQTGELMTNRVKSIFVKNTAGKDFYDWRIESASYGLPGSVPHSAIDGLNNDDHALYANIIGRAGGQILHGGTSNGDDLTLKDNSNENNSVTVKGLITHMSESNPHNTTAQDVNALAKDNTSAYTPTADYHPATRKFVEDVAAGAGILGVSLASIKLRSTLNTQIASTTPVNLGWTTTIDKDAGYTHSTSVNNESITVDVAGVYLVGGTISTQSNTGTARAQIETRLYVNNDVEPMYYGFSYNRNEGYYASSNLGPTILRLQAGDSIRFAAQTVNDTDASTWIGANSEIYLVKLITINEGALEFTELLDAPDTFTGAAGRFVKVNSIEDALEFVDVSVFDISSNTMDDIQDGTTYVKTENNYTDADKAKVDSVEAGAEANNMSDVNAAALTSGADSIQHYHASDRARANHTGVQPASTISDFDTEVSANTDVTAALAHVSTGSNPHNVTADQLNAVKKDNVDAYSVTGDYNPVHKKYLEDTLATEVVQSDWDESDNNSNAFIKNKTEDLTKTNLTGQVQLKGNISTPQYSDFRVNTSDGVIKVQRYSSEAADWKNSVCIDDNIETTDVLFKGTDGLLGFKDSGKIHSLIQPSNYIPGVMVGNPDGRITLQSDGEYFHIYPTSDKYWLENQPIDSVVESYNNGSYVIVPSTKHQAVFTIRLKCLTAGVKVRIVVESLNESLEVLGKLAETCSLSDFEEGVGNVYTTVVGANELDFLSPMVIERDLNMKISIFTDSPIDLQGMTSAPQPNGHLPYMAVYREELAFDNSAYFPKWTDGKDFALNDMIFISKSELPNDELDKLGLWICNTAGVQNTSFLSNITKWTRLGGIGEENHLGAVYFNESHENGIYVHKHSEPSSNEYVLAKLDHFRGASFGDIRKNTDIIGDNINLIKILNTTERYAVNHDLFDEQLTTSAFSVTLNGIVPSMNAYPKFKFLIDRECYLHLLWEVWDADISEWINASETCPIAKFQQQPHLGMHYQDSDEWLTQPKVPILKTGDSIRVTYTFDREVSIYGHTYSDVYGTGFRPRKYFTVQTVEQQPIASQTWVNAQGHELTSNKGVANGYAELNAESVIPLSQLPAAVKNTASSYLTLADRNAADHVAGDIVTVNETSETYGYNGVSWITLQTKAKLPDVIDGGNANS